MTHIKHLGLLILLIISNTSCIQGNTADTKNKDSAEKKGEIMTIGQDMVNYIKKGNLKKVQQYIENTSVHINARGNNTDRDDWTSLIWATYYEQFEIVKYLVDTSVRRANGADLNIRDEDTYTALMWASRQGYVEIGKYLIDNGADVNSKKGDPTALIEASSGPLELVKYLVENGADVNAKDDFKDYTALLNASDKGNTEVVKYLVDTSVRRANGADVNARGYLGYTPLIYASQNGHLEIVKYLVLNGADINIKDENMGMTALVWASDYGYLEIVKVLVENGADINAGGGSALRSASKNGHTEIVEYLKSHSVTSP